MSPHPRIKICGLTREADVDDAIDAGADALGFVLYAKSPRHVAAGPRRRTGARLPPFVTPVLLFVNASPSEVQRATDRLPQALLQFHGDETPEQCQAARPALDARRTHGAGLRFARLRAALPGAQALLLDAHVEGYGGGGKAFDWSLIPRNVPLPVVLSGGLNPANVIDGVMGVRPWAVDVSSGVEAGQGRQERRADAPVLQGGARSRRAHRRPLNHPPAAAQGSSESTHVELPATRCPRAFRALYGGTFVAETLIHALHELEGRLRPLPQRPGVRGRVPARTGALRRPAQPVYHAARLSREIGGAQIHLKREDLNHTGAHKVNNTIGQALLARRMGKPRVIAETGAGQHGVATATICARYGMECVVYMGSEDVKRQSPNVYRMHLLGATVVPVESGSKTLKDALNEALRDWVTNVENTFYIIGTVAGPHPYPMMVRDFQRVIGDECLTQMPEMIGRQPDAVIACVGGGSNAMGIFYPYIPHDGVRLIGVEAAGQGLDTGKHAASLSAGSPACCTATAPTCCRTTTARSPRRTRCRPGLDYPGVGPEHAYLKDIGRAEYVGITDDEALAAFHRLCRTEGIIPALESSHAVAYAMKLAATMRPDQHLLVNLSGRGDKDIGTVADLSGAEFFCRPSCRGQSVKGGADRRGEAMSRIQATLAALQQQAARR
jgi:tryptophan synthase beta chain